MCDLVAHNANFAKIKATGYFVKFKRVNYESGFMDTATRGIQKIP